MPSGKSSFVEKVLGRIGRLDAEGLQQVVQRLASERNFLETLLNTIEDGVVVTDAQGHVLHLNQSATRLLGLQAATAEGQSISKYLPGLDWATIASSNQSDQPRMARHELEVTYPRPRFLRLLAVPLAGADGAAPTVVLVLHDATEARQKTFEAIESERLQALTLLAAGVAHEIGNPLNALHIHLQLMERELRRLGSVDARTKPKGSAARKKRARASGRAAKANQVTAKLNKYLDVAKGEIARLDYIVTQFLQAIRPTQPQIRPSSINQTVLATLELLRPELDNRGLIVREELGRRLPDAAFDPAQIKQALLNLIKNSMQAMTRGGVLTLETGASADGVWVAVGDTGGGIPQDRLNRLFEAFYTTKEKGTGLGLLIVHRIMREHGGRIDVESRVGKGTVLRLYLPFHEPRPRLLSAGAADKKPETQPRSTPTGDRTGVDA